MKININIKGVSNKQNKIKKLVYDYPSKNPYTMADFLKETVQICLENYESSTENAEVMKMFSKEEIEDAAASGKVLFGVHFNQKKPDPQKAELNAIQAFEDGMVAVFIDGVQYENIESVIDLKEGSEVVFVKLSLLAGRMW